MGELEGSAVVLGGGGITGIAWEIGLLTGLLEKGIDLTQADRFIGTSAGSVVAAQILSGRAVGGLYAAQQRDASNEPRAQLSRLILLRVAWALWREKTPEGFGARMGRLAMSTKTETEAERRAVFQAFLGELVWPARPLLVTAVNAATGEFRVFDRSSGVSLADAVGSSCAVPGVWPPVTLGTERYIDGGMRSMTNAHVAQGSREVVILAPLAFGAGPIPSLRTQVDALKAGGASVVAVTPDATARRAMGPNALDPARRAVAATEGHRQASEVFEHVGAVWRKRTF